MRKIDRVHDIKEEENSLKKKNTLEVGVYKYALSVSSSSSRDITNNDEQSIINKDGLQQHNVILR